MADTSLNENRISILIWQISNLWHSRLRKSLKESGLSINEFLILETIYRLSNIYNQKNISQTNISFHSSIDNSVVSSKILALEKKGYIQKITSSNSRSNSINLTPVGKDLVSEIINNVNSEESLIFEKLGAEKNNFINTLRLILGKKIRIKVSK